MLQGLPLLATWPRLAFITDDGMQLELDGVPGCVPTVPLTPIIADCIRKDVAILGETSRSDATADLGVAFETVLCVLVPEVEGAIATGSAEGAVLGVEGDGVYGVDFCDVPRCRVLCAMAFEGEVEAGYILVG